MFINEDIKAFSKVILILHLRGLKFLKHFFIAIVIFYRLNYFKIPWNLK